LASWHRIYIVFSMLLLIFILLKEDQSLKPFISFLSIITGSSLIYISYNLSAMTLMLLAVITTLLAIIHIIPIKYNKIGGICCLPLIKTFFNLLLILSIVELGLSKFVYGVFIPTLQAAQELEISSWDKFLISYFSPDLSTTPLGPFMVSYPAIISVISVIKYSFLIITILIFCIVTANVILRKRLLEHTSFFILAVLLMYGLYTIPRFMIGGIVVAALWLPGILCVARLLGMSKKFRVWAFISIFIILICSFLYYYTMESNGYIDCDEYQFTSYQAPVHWFIKTNNGDLAVSDELTNDFSFYTLYSTLSLTAPQVQTMTLLLRNIELCLRRMLRYLRSYLRVL